MSAYGRAIPSYLEMKLTDHLRSATDTRYYYNRSKTVTDYFQDVDYAIPVIRRLLSPLEVLLESPSLLSSDTAKLMLLCLSVTYSRFLTNWLGVGEDQKKLA